MSENLYLILHKVRGEPAFDVASRLEVTEGDGASDTNTMPEPVWIIPTSGHRAYPWWFLPLQDILLDPDFAMTGGQVVLPPMPVNQPDHYAVNEALNRPVPIRRALAPTTDDFLL